MAVVLVVDDELNQRSILKTILSAEGYETHVASSGEEALKIMRSFHPDVVLTDLKMEGMDGIELMEKIKSDENSAEVILMTAFGTIPSVVEAMNKGAYSYIEKPLDKDRVLLNVKNAFEKTRLLRENRDLHRALHDKFGIHGIVGSSNAMREVIGVVRKVANSPVTVLILGESGTGKELVARAIHYNSQRRSKLFTAINCAAIPETLLRASCLAMSRVRLRVRWPERSGCLRPPAAVQCSLMSWEICQP